MKIAFEQNKSIIAGLFVLVLLAAAWFSRDQIAVFPGQNENAVSNAPVRAKEAIVTKVIDGDTIVVSGGDHVRLLGIDADEKGYPCHNAGRLRLEELILGKTVLLEADSEDLDQYGRQLRYIFLDSENINQKMVAEGLAIARFYPENQKYKNEIVAAETKAIESKTGCKWGK
ncbi:MAG: thermonuclease family protein [Minisyncoccales bacterium]